MHPTRHVMKDNEHLAMVVKCPREADAYRPGEPWTLLHNTGRVDRFATYAEARDEALKSYPGSRLSLKD